MGYGARATAVPPVTGDAAVGKKLSSGGRPPHIGAYSLEKDRHVASLRSDDARASRHIDIESASRGATCEVARARLGEKLIRRPP